MHPYYIVAPRWSRTSAGARVLYRLCDLINRSGATSYIYLRPFSNSDLANSPSDISPWLTSKVVDFHFKNGITPIVIYPETFHIDNLTPPVKVRYLLNYNSLLFKDESLIVEDYCIAYSKAIEEAYKEFDSVIKIFIPVSDANFFLPLLDVSKYRHGSVFYAGKYKYFFGGKTFEITNGITEITRDCIDSQTPEQIRDLFQTSEYFYCYEDSALAIEAMLCGCPVIFLPNEYFLKPLGAAEIGSDGWSWGTEPESVARAKATVHLFRDRYLKLQEEAVLAVREMIEATQKIAANKPYTKRFAEGYLKPPGLIVQAVDICRFLSDVLQDKGFIGTAKIIFKRIRAGRFKIYS